jgi:hypothetical protein
MRPDGRILVCLTEEANQALEWLVDNRKKTGVPSNKGAMASEVMLKAAADAKAILD